MIFRNRSKAFLCAKSGPKKPRAKPRHLEDALQANCVEWFRYQYPGKLLFAIPNGGERNAREGARLKSQGVTKGVPDLVIPEPTRGRPGLWIEMKSEEGRVKPEQREMLAALKARGYETQVCWSFEEFQQVVNRYFGEHKIMLQGIPFVFDSKIPENTMEMRDENGKLFHRLVFKT